MHIALTRLRLSLILTDVYLFWATMSLPREGLSLRQTLVLRGKLGAHQIKPVRKTIKDSNRESTTRP